MGSREEFDEDNVQIRALAESMGNQIVQSACTVRDDMVTANIPSPIADAVTMNAVTTAAADIMTHYIASSTFMVKGEKMSASEVLKLRAEYRRKVGLFFTGILAASGLGPVARVETENGQTKETIIDGEEGEFEMPPPPPAHDEDAENPAIRRARGTGKGPDLN